VPRIAQRVSRSKDLTEGVADLKNVEIVKSFDPKVGGEARFSSLPQWIAVYEGLKGVTSRGNGTASDAFEKSPTKWAMAGKTGTAQAGTKKNPKADTSLFVGWGPADNPSVPPEYAAAAMIPEGGFGAHAAAPLVFSIMRALSFGEVPVQTPAVKASRFALTTTTMAAPTPPATPAPPAPNAAGAGDATVPEKTTTTAAATKRAK
jgi:membrane peptidoglycan carboxypeptidase